MTVVGGIFNAMFADIYYRIVQPRYMLYLTNFLNKFMNFNKWKQVGTSLFIDMVVLCIPLIAGLIFSTEMMGNKGDFEKSWDVVKEKLIPSTLACYKFYPPALIILYGFIPIYMRGVCANIISAIWGTIFSFIQHND